jgi:hypothetical protein
VAVFALLLEGVMVLAQRLLDPVARARRTGAGGGAGSSGRPAAGRASAGRRAEAVEA